MGSRSGMNCEIASALSALHLRAVWSTSVEIEAITRTKRKFTIAANVVHLSLHHENELLARMLSQLKARLFSVDRNHGGLHNAHATSWDQHVVVIRQVPMVPVTDRLSPRGT